MQGKTANNDFTTEEEFDDDSHCQECACYPLYPFLLFCPFHSQQWFRTSFLIR